MQENRSQDENGRKAFPLGKKIINVIKENERYILEVTKILPVVKM